uniref:Neuropeptide n=1 Tax=Ascaris lumbricoides TaxID=6252 RepID=A0A0M3IPR9_ASCLU
MSSMHTIRWCFLQALMLSVVLNALFACGSNLEDETNEFISVPVHWDIFQTQLGLPIFTPVERANEGKRAESDRQMRLYLHRASRLPPRIRKHVTRSQVAKMRCFFNPISC